MSIATWCYLLKPRLQVLDLLKQELTYYVVDLLAYTA